VSMSRSDRGSERRRGVSGVQLPGGQSEPQVVDVQTERPDGAT